MEFARADDPLNKASTILLVDDSEGSREVIAAILARAGYTVLEAPNGSDAAQILDRDPGTIDLLITDTQMPGMTGPQLIRHTRHLHPLTRVLCISGQPLDVSLPVSTPFLQKPLDLKLLLSKVREILLEERILPAPSAATA
jgi:two-component system, cell cycle sensor histidine kinase and response regulator CckA